MYGIFTYIIYHKFTPNAGKYSIHREFGGFVFGGFWVTSSLEDLLIVSDHLFLEVLTIVPFESLYTPEGYHFFYKFNMEPDKTPPKEEKHLPNHHFQVPAVNLRGRIFGVATSLTNFLVSHRLLNLKNPDSSPGSSRIDGRNIPSLQKYRIFRTYNTIHGTGIFTYISHKNQPNVGTYTSPMDGMG